MASRALAYGRVVARALPTRGGRKCDAKVEPHSLFCPARRHDHPDNTPGPSVKLPHDGTSTPFAPRCAAIAVAARPPNYSLPRTCRAVKISKRIQLADHACCIFRSATLPTTSSPLRALALAALTFASPSRTPVRPPRPSTAGSLSAPSSTSTTSRRSRRPSP